MNTAQERQEAAIAICLMGGRQKRASDDAESAERRVQTRRAIELRQEQREIKQTTKEVWES